MLVGTEKYREHLQVTSDPHAITQNVDVPVVCSWSSGTDPRYSPSESLACGSVALSCEAATIMEDEEVVADEETKRKFLKRRVVVLKESMAVELLGSGAAIDEQQDGRGIVDRGGRERVVKCRLGRREVSTVRSRGLKLGSGSTKWGLRRVWVLGSSSITTHGVYIPQLHQSARSHYRKENRAGSEDVNSAISSPDIPCAAGKHHGRHRF